jgi:hypothetical protein
VRHPRRASDAAQRLADGFCHKFIACCYTFFDSYVQGLPKQTVCECTSDPTYGGQYASCEALAAAHERGAVIDICPGYEPRDIVP